MRMHTCRLGFVSLIVVAFILSGCQMAQKSEVETNVDAAEFSEEAKQEESSPEKTSNHVQYRDNYTNADGSVSFAVDIDASISVDELRTVEVRPHQLSESDIHRVAKVLLGDVDFYERRTSSNPQYSKEQYQTMIDRLAAYADDASLISLMGKDGANVYAEYIQQTITFWEGKKETAPEDDPRILCDWTLKKERHYNDHAVEIGDRTIEDDYDVLYANAEVNGIEYMYSVSSHVTDTERVHFITLNLTEGLGLYPVDMAIYRSMLCRTEMPTDEQITACMTIAQNMLDRMALGQWVVNSATIDERKIDDTTEYSIHVTATPLLDDMASEYDQKTRNKQNEKQRTFAMTSACFDFSSGGDILYFNLTSPVDVIRTHEEKPDLLSAEELLNSLKQQLSSDDTMTFGISKQTQSEIEKSVEERLICTVQILKAEYGLGRVNASTTEEQYNYVPVIAFRGIVTYVGEESGTVWYKNPQVGYCSSVICLNAVDGTII